MQSDKLEARKSTKRDEFDEHSVNPESRKSSSSSEKDRGSSHMNGSSVRLHHPEPPLPQTLTAPLPPQQQQLQYKARPRIELPGPPGGLEKNLDKVPPSPPVNSSEPTKKEKKVSKIRADQEGEESA